MLESVEILSESIKLSENENSLIISKSSFSIELQRLATVNSSNDSRNYSYQDTRQGVFLPLEVLQQIEDSSPQVVLARYQSKGLFVRRRESHLIVDSDIISASISHTNIEGLREPVVIVINANVR